MFVLSASVSVRHSRMRQTIHGSELAAKTSEMSQFSVEFVRCTFFANLRHVTPLVYKSLVQVSGESGSLAIAGHSREPQTVRVKQAQISMSRKCSARAAVTLACVTEWLLFTKKIVSVEAVIPRWTKFYIPPIKGKR